MQTQGAQPYADVDDIPAFVLGGGRLDLPSLTGGSLETAHALPEFNEIMASVFSPPEPTPRPSIAEITQRLQNARAVHFLDWDLDELQAWLDRLGIPPDSDLYEAYEITCPADIYENLKSDQRGADGAVKARYWDSAEEISEDSGLGDPQAVRELYRELDGFERLGEYAPYLFCVIFGPVYQEYFGADAVVSAWGLSAVKYYLSITDPQTTATLVLAVALLLLSILTPILTIRQALYYYKEFSIVTLTLSKSKFKVDLTASSRFDATQVTTGPELGSGAFGTVFRGDLRTDVGSGSLTTPVAVKTVKSALI
eukprot:g3191.t1